MVRFHPGRFGPFLQSLADVQIVPQFAQSLSKLPPGWRKFSIIRPGFERRAELQKRPGQLLTQDFQLPDAVVLVFQGERPLPGGAFPAAFERRVLQFVQLALVGVHQA
jgi:hypothetical protein